MSIISKRRISVAIDERTVGNDGPVCMQQASIVAEIDAFRNHGAANEAAIRNHEVTSGIQEEGFNVRSIQISEGTVNEAKDAGVGHQESRRNQPREGS